MIKLLVFDYVGQSKPWIQEFINLDKVKVTRTILLSDKAQDKLVTKTNWDYILVFEQNMRNIFQETISKLKISPQKIIYAMDLSSWAANPEAVHYILKSRYKHYDIIHRYLDLGLEQQVKKFITCTTADGLSYIATSRDKYVLPYMYLHGRNHAADEMEAFYQLAQKYYYNNDLADSKGGGISLI